MNQMLREAAEALRRKEATLLVLGGAEPYWSFARGIAPIIDRMEEQPDFFRNTYVADKVTGRAAALLLVKAGIRGLHTRLISDLAVDILEHAGIELVYEQKVPKILNRAGNGFCPMETAVENICDPEEAYQLLLKKRRQMREHAAASTGEK